MRQTEEDWKSVPRVLKPRQWTSREALAHNRDNESECECGTLVVRSREVGGQTANLVSIVSAVVLKSFRPMRLLPSRARPSYPCSPSGAESVPIVQWLPRLRISLARNTTRSVVYLLLFHAGRKQAGGEGTYARSYPDRMQEFSLCVGRYRITSVQCAMKL